MTSFNTAASLLLEPLINMHLTICHILFKTSCHINFNIKRFRLNRGCASWKTFLNINLLLGGKPQASCTKHSMTVSANISKTKLIAQYHPLRNARDFTPLFWSSLPRRCFQGSSYFVPSHKSRRNREQHSFPIVSQSHCTFQILEGWPWPAG